MASEKILQAEVCDLKEKLEAVSRLQECAETTNLRKQINCLEDQVSNFLEDMMNHKKEITMLMKEMEITGLACENLQGKFLAKMAYLVS